jgi:2-amino-4-hydroxy-6-hydroxymethyldihydropteridine diphosphokinase
MIPRATVFLGLGSNLEQPLVQLSRALREVHEIPSTALVRVSSFYDTVPIGLADQPNFVNAVAELQTGLNPSELLNHLIEIEAAHQRVRSVRDGPRTLDLDILLYDDICMNEPMLTIPHPRMHARAFVLWPLAEIAPELVIPGRGYVLELLVALDVSGVRKYEEGAR